jgi:peptidyl-prolyl cis-trans isomerase C
VLLSVLLSVLVAGALVWVVVARLTGLPSDAAFRVDSTVVTKDQLNQRMSVLEGLYAFRVPVDGPALDQFHRASAKSIAVAMVLDHVADERGIVVTDQEADTALDQLIARRNDVKGREGFIRVLGNAGVSQVDVLDELKRQLRFSRLSEEVTAQTPAVTDADVQGYFDTHHGDLVAPALRDLRNIVVDDKDLADQLLGQARQGADFGLLARENSLDEKTRDSQGELGSVSRDQVERAYGDAAFSAAPGSYFGPVRTSYGWNVGLVMAVTPARPKTYDEVAGELRTQLTAQRKVSAWTTWLANQMRQASIQYADDYRPPQSDVPPAALDVAGPADRQEAPPR